MNKVLIVNLHYETGGIKKTLQDLIKNIRKDYQISVMFFNSPSDTSGLEGVAIIQSPFLIDSYLSSHIELKKKNWYLVRLVIKLIFTIIAKIIGQERVIHLLVAFSKNVNSDIAISYTHDIWLENGRFSGGTNYFVNKKVHSKKKIAWIHGEPRTIGLNEERAKSTYDDFDYVVNVSKSCKKEFDMLFPNSKKSFYIRNMYDVETITHKSKEIVSIRKNGITFVTVSRLSSTAKGVDKINKIAKKLKDNGQEFSWYVVGGGPEYESCVDECIKLGLDDCVYYVGPQDNPYKYISQADMLVVTSDSEAYCTVIVEALICGKPVLTTNFNSACEMIVNGKTGIISEKGADDLYDSMRTILIDPNILKRMENNIRSIKFTNEESLESLSIILN